MQEMTVIFESKLGACKQVLSVVAVSSDLAPDRAFAPSFFARTHGQLPPSSHYTMQDGSRQAKLISPFP
jgi:hypothetical protein